MLLLSNGRLVKTKKYRKPQYIGDPTNTVRIFNELEADEIIVLDIAASKKGMKPDFRLLEEIANEAFMPMAYGGGVASFSDARTIFNIGFEKVILNTAAIKNHNLISEIASVYGNQAVVVSIDVKHIPFLGKRVMRSGGRIFTKLLPDIWATDAVGYGAGELLITSIDNEGMWDGMDISTIQSIVNAVPVPVIANGGVGNLGHIVDALELGCAHSVAIGSAVVFQKRDSGVLVNFRLRDEFLMRGFKFAGVNMPAPIGTPPVN